jgi:hypothetical protein
MNSFLTVLLALGITAAAPPLARSNLERAISNYRALLLGQKQFVDLTPAERLDLIELDKWLRSAPAATSSETKEHCKARLASRSPSPLEEALLDLKCSQRPDGS